MGQTERDVEQQNHRPAEVQQQSALQRLRNRLLDGLESRSMVLLWLQSVSIYSYGQIPTEHYREFAEEFRPDNRRDEGVILAAFLSEDARSRDMENEVAEQIREKWAADVLAPVQSDAFRAIRRDATEYVGEDGDGEAPTKVGGNISEQPIVYRPALDDLNTAQQETLLDALHGLDTADNRRAILDWGDSLVKATRGEPIRKELEVGEFVQLLHNHASGDRIMGSQAVHWYRFRQWMLCQFVLPAFNRAVQDLSKRSKEEPAESTTGGLVGKQG